MFRIDEDKTIHVTRGDAVTFDFRVVADGEEYLFRDGDVVRFKVFAKKSCDDVVLSKEFPATAGVTILSITLTGEDTKIGETISKPTDYWYEVELNPHIQPVTIIGYDEDGAKVFKLYPEGGEENE